MATSIAHDCEIQVPMLNCSLNCVFCNAAQTVIALEPSKELPTRALELT
jgi:wyosine [tRNA(Phe)-imidazoG37] synthetase (radical SAM superfamily)